MAFPKYQDTYKKFLSNLRLFDAPSRVLLQKAFAIARREHRGQKKFGLWTYIIHPLAIFNFLVEKLKINEPDILIAALLHDTVEDGDITLFDIKKLFGEKTHNIMAEITRFRSPDETEEEKEINKQKHLEKIIKSSPEAKMIKLADEYDNMQNWLKIPKKNHNRRKFPRWFSEAKKHLILAKKTNETIFKIMSAELKKIKSSTSCQQQNKKSLRAGH